MASARPRVLILVNAFEADAPTKLMVAVAEAAAKGDEFDCAMAALSRGGDLKEDAHRACGRAYVLSSRKLGHWHGVVGLAALIRDYKPDILHTSLTRPALTGVVVARRCGKAKIILTHHGSHEWQEQGKLSAAVVPRLYPIAARAAANVVAVSVAVKKQLDSVGIADKKITVIHNGIDEVIFNPGERQSRGEILHQLFPGDDPEDIVLVGAAGRLKVYKGYETLIEAAARLRPCLRSVRFVVWGDGEERTRLNSAIASHGLDRAFVLPGDFKDMPRRLAACDVFVQPSLEEAFGLATAEAMSCEVACVVSDAGGLPELIESEISGCIFKKADSASLVVTLEPLLLSKSKRRRLGEGGRKRILEKFTLRRMTWDYLNLYRRLLGLQEKE